MNEKDMSRMNLNTLRVSLEQREASHRSHRSHRNRSLRVKKPTKAMGQSSPTIQVTQVKRETQRNLGVQIRVLKELPSKVSLVRSILVNTKVKKCSQGSSLSLV